MTRMDPWKRFRLFACVVPIFLIIGALTGVLAEVSVNFAHLALVYGVQDVASGKIWFASTKPGLLVSNGDTLTGFHVFAHFVATALMWFGPFIGVMLLVARALFDPEEPEEKRK
jgi:hypothetical protein